VWEPQVGPQSLAIDTAGLVDEVFFGGAVGGGKSDYLLGDFAQDVDEFGENWRGILFRRTYGELEELIARSLEIYPRWFDGAVYKDSKSTWVFPSGSTLKLRYLEHANDWMRYWGHQYTWIGWDELPSWKNLIPYHKMKARLRSAHDIPVKRIRSSGNPGGPSHLAVKQYFGIDEHPNGSVLIADEKTRTTRMFIKSRVQDNLILMQNDPGYVDRLHGLGSEQLVKAWLEGDWNVVEGAYFDCWSDDIIIRPCELPEHWTRFRSFDWGSARPFSCGWWAVASEDFIHPDGQVIPKNALVRYREWYGASGPNVGLKLTVEQVATEIVSRETEDPKIHYGVADPAIFAQDGGPSMAERMAKATHNKVLWRRADNKRVATHGHIGGWDQMRARMVGDERPMIYCFDTCTDSIRTIPSLQHDESKPEDLDTEGEDHAADEWRYGCMSRPYTKPKPTKEKPIKGIEAMSLNDLWNDRPKGKRI